MKPQRLVQIPIVLLILVAIAIVWVIPPNSAFSARFGQGLRILGLGGGICLLTVALMRRLWPFALIGLGMLLSLVDPARTWLVVTGDAIWMAGALLLAHSVRNPAGA
jgi:hypothetical protein